MLYVKSKEELEGLAKNQYDPPTCKVTSPFHPLNFDNTFLVR